jgi:PPOX class probable F420-dependent enzyme
MHADEMRRRATSTRVCRVGTLDERGRVHLVPIVFVIEGDTLYSSTDAGPRPVKRLRNLERDPHATAVFDAYDEDWSTVWWVRVQGKGRTVTDPLERDHARDLLWSKYPQFTTAPPDEGRGPIMALDIEHWAGWAYSA